MMKIGSFLTGIFHLKTTCSFIQGVELVPDNYKTRMIVMLNAFYFTCTVFVGVFYLVIAADTYILFATYYYIAIIAAILYFLLVPESPYWLVRNEGPNSQRAIKNLNYIAKFNGSKQRISNDTILVIDKCDAQII